MAFRAYFIRKSFTGIRKGQGRAFARPFPIYREWRLSMQGYNLIAVFGPDERTLLLCRRCRDLYKRLLNFVGGKIEPEEDGLDAA